jgi:hypothetical protein
MSTVQDKKIGRFDDLVAVFGTPLEKDAITQWADAMKAGNLLAFKWCNIKKAKKLREHFGMSPKDFRKFVVNGRKGIIETLMSEKKWDEINYPHVPSVAMSRYTKAFTKNDGTRFSAFANDKTAKVNSAVLFPYDILRGLNASGDDVLARKQWDAMKLDTQASLIPVIDVSGSMSGCRAAGQITCMDAAVALGVFLSMKNKGAFQNTFINFSETPTIHRINPRANLSTIFRDVMRSQWGGSTNFKAAYKEILRHAVAAKATQDELPKYIVVLSDMQFNDCGGGTSFEDMAKEFKAHGYTLPTIVFWCMNSMYGNFPTTAQKGNVAMVSGFSPAVLKAVLSANISAISPKNIMEEAIKPYRDLLK